MDCHDCGTDLDVRMYGLCGRCFRRWVKRTCDEQSVPVHSAETAAAFAAALDAQLCAAS